MFTTEAAFIRYPKLWGHKASLARPPISYPLQHIVKAPSMKVATASVSHLGHGGDAFVPQVATLGAWGVRVHSSH